MGPLIPLVRLFWIEGFAKGFPRIALALGIGIAAYAAGLAMLLLYLPGLLRALAWITGIAMAAAIWFWRPSYGVRGGLPPGSLSPFASLRAIFDHRFYLRQAERHGRVFKMLQFHRPVVCVVGFETGHELIRMDENMLAPAAQPYNSDIPGGFLRYMEPETHAFYAPKFRAAFSLAVTRAAEPLVRRVIVNMLDEMATAAAVGPRRHLYRGMFESLAYLIFGFFPGSREVEQFTAAFRIFEEQDLSRQLSDRTKKALFDLRSQTLRQICRLQRDIDAPFCVMKEWLNRQKGDPDQTMIDNMLFILRIGSDNLSGLLTWILKMLTDHPEWAERMRGETDKSALAERIVMETVRMEQSEYLYRTIRSPLKVGPYRIPAGWTLRVCVRESHRDPAVFEKPETFNPDRFLSRKDMRSGYSPFGTDRHACIAIGAIHSVARIFVEEITVNYTCTVIRDGPRERPPRHWHHWEPSSRFSVALCCKPQ